jgi:hypothetical protein
MRYLLIPLAATAAFLLVAQGPAEAKFASTSTQGNSGKTNTNANPDNKGQVTTTGPKGQLKQGKTSCNNCTSTGPGNSP